MSAKSIFKFLRWALNWLSTSAASGNSLAVADFCFSSASSASISSRSARSASSCDRSSCTSCRSLLVTWVLDSKSVT
jgi:hypothetical protein